jgi:pyroglutamyl-peptidase
MSRMLLTTFQTWLPHQQSNSSDDLIGYLDAIAALPPDTHLLRHVPVNFQLAPQMVLGKVREIRPDVILCCGMAEPRSRLSVESNGQFQSDLCFTPIDLDALISCTTDTFISHNAGKFVCNYLYYQVLRHLERERSTAKCLFVHVPLLDESNKLTVAEDFVAILRCLL